MAYFNIFVMSDSEDSSFDESDNDARGGSNEKKMKNQSLRLEMTAMKNCL